MTYDASILDDTAARSARLVALSLMEDLAHERERLAAEKDSETLHDFRVALRRLRSWLRSVSSTPLRTGPPSSIAHARRLRCWSALDDPLGKFRGTGG